MNGEHTVSLLARFTLIELERGAQIIDGEAFRELTSVGFLVVPEGITVAGRQWLERHRDDYAKASEVAEAIYGFRTPGGLFGMAGAKA